MQPKSFIISAILLSLVFAMAWESELSVVTHYKEREEGPTAPRREKRHPIFGALTAAGVTIANLFNGTATRTRRSPIIGVASAAALKFAELFKKTEKSRTKRTITKRGKDERRQDVLSDAFGFGPSNTDDIPLFAGFRTGHESRDVHFKQLGFTAITTEFAHIKFKFNLTDSCLLYTSPSPRDS